MEAPDTVSSPAHGCHLMSVATTSGSGVALFSFILKDFIGSICVLKKLLALPIFSLAIV